MLLEEVDICFHLHGAKKENLKKQKVEMGTCVEMKTWSLPLWSMPHGKSKCFFLLVMRRPSCPIETVSLMGPLF